MNQKDTEYSYQERFVAFLDILGFGDLIRRSVLDPPEVTIADITSALDLPKPVQKGKMLISEVGDISESDHRITQFSDCIVISTQSSEAGLLYIVDHVERIAFSLLKLGFLCRGGVSKGLLFHEKNIVFGPAMIDAYKLENEQAINPRVILSREVESFALGMSAGQIIKRKLYKCEDFYIVHVLRLLAFALTIPCEVGEWETAYLNIRLHLQKEISRLSDRCKEQDKIKWFKKYFDQTVSVDPAMLAVAISKQQQG